MKTSSSSIKLNNYLPVYLRDRPTESVFHFTDTLFVFSPWSRRVLDERGGLKPKDRKIEWMGFISTSRQKSRVFERRWSNIDSHRSAVTSHPGEESQKHWFIFTKSLWNNHHFDKVAAALTKWLLAKKTRSRMKKWRSGDVTPLWSWTLWNCYFGFYSEGVQSCVILLLQSSVQQIIKRPHAR